ncbi:MAG: AAA family ATPase, partial [Proteobacteria bacterium]|nr:AAA family ATPase [Pseudomonadota bacterium]
MELVSLELEHFGCVGRAALAFKPGLNVLHGSNEVGKSSIARAIRFALLLPASSSAVEPWIPWVGGGDPTVTLAFRTSATEYHRVRKVYGKATASLDRSSDGVGWSTVARARDVEGRLRGILQWGIAEPGGAKAKKGVGQSFLASALLADQDAVTGVFARALDLDDIESGRAQIRSALSAIAQDPLFKSALDAAQLRADEAFGPNGKRKHGVKDPFRKMADEIAARRAEHAAATQEATSSRTLGERVGELQQAAARADGDLHAAVERRSSLEERAARHAALAAAVATSRSARTLVDAVTEATGKVSAAKRTLDEWGPRLPALRKSEEDTRKTFEATTARASAAREKRRGELALEETGILRAGEVLRDRRTCAEAVLAVQKANELRDRGVVVAEQIARLDGEIATLEHVDTWLELRAAQVALDDVARREREGRELLAQSIELRERAAKEWPSTHSDRLPAAKQLAELRKLRGKLDVAEGKLAVGLVIAVTGATSASVAIDGGLAAVKIAPFSIEASTLATIALRDGVEITVRGGRADDRASVDGLRSQWREATEELFATLGLADLEALEEVCRIDGERKVRADALGREAGNIDARHLALGDVNADRLQRGSRITELEARLGDADRAAIEAASSTHGSGVRKVRAGKHADRESNRVALANARAQEAGLRERASASPIASSDLDGAVELAAVEVASRDLLIQAKRVAADRAVLDAPRGKRDALEEAALAAREALRVAGELVTTATSERDTWDARLQERSVAIAAIDLDVLARAEADARAAAGDGRSVDDATISGARSAEVIARSKYETIASELLKAEGGLVASGGTA